MSNIENLNIAHLDIRMLLALEVLLRERSVNVAAMHAGLSQPAMSNALARMRAAFGDPLLVRGRKGLILTERGELLLAQLTEVLPRIKELGRAVSFQPENTRRSFQVAVTDYTAIVLLPLILSAFRTKAPMATLKAVTVQSRQIDMARLEAAGFDVHIGWFESLPPNWHARTLFKEELVVIKRTEAKRGRTDALDLETFLRLKHVVVAPEQRSMRNLAESALAAKGLKREIGAFVSGYSAMPFIVSQSDMIALVPRGVAGQFSFLPGIHTLPSPFPFQRFAISVAWHERVHHDTANSWLRSLIISSAAEFAQAAHLEREND